MSAAGCVNEAVAILLRIAEFPDKSIQATALESIRMVLKDSMDRQTIAPHLLRSVQEWWEEAKDGSA